MATAFRSNEALCLLLFALTGALSGCAVPMGVLRPGSVASAEGLAIPAADAPSLYQVRDEWMRFDFDSDMDYARLIRRREMNVYVRLRWCGRDVPGRELMTARVFADDGRVDASSRLAPVPSSRPGEPAAFRYHTYVRVRVPKGPVLPPGAPEQGGDYDLQHPSDNVCLSVAGGDMAGNHGETLPLVYFAVDLRAAFRPDDVATTEVVPFCAVAERKGDYNGRTVRVRATYTTDSSHYEYLKLASCANGLGLVDIGKHGQSESVRAFDAESKQICAAHHAIALCILSAEVDVEGLIREWPGDPGHFVLDLDEMNGFKFGPTDRIRDSIKAY
jgi:hypothetical protein